MCPSRKNNCNTPTKCNHTISTRHQIKRHSHSICPSRRMTISGLLSMRKLVGRGISVPTIARFIIGKLRASHNRNSNYISCSIIKHMKMLLKAYHPRGQANCCRSILEPEYHSRSMAAAMWPDLLAEVCCHLCTPSINSPSFGRPKM